MDGVQRCHGKLCGQSEPDWGAYCRWQGAFTQAGRPFLSHSLSSLAFTFLLMQKICGRRHLRMEFRQSRFAFSMREREGLPPVLDSYTWPLTVSSSCSPERFDEQTGF